MSVASDVIARASLLEWHKVRKLFGIENFAIIPFLARAATCSHPDAQWMCKIFAGKNVTSREEAKTVFLQHLNDPRALCFASLILDAYSPDVDMLRHSADLGYGFAQALMVVYGNFDEGFKYAQRSAASGDSDGYFFLSLCFMNKIGCEVDLVKVKENVLLAAELGHVSAIETVAENITWLFDEFDPRRWYWLGEAAMRCRASHFVSSSFSF